MNVRFTAALVLSAALPLTAAAQTPDGVSVYGILDLYMGYTNHVPLDATQPANGRSSKIGMGSGGWNTSRLGFKGSETLSPDLSAQFNLEHGLAANTGAAIGAFWARQAWVGLTSKSWGQLQLGRTTTTINDMVLSHDPMRNATRFSWLPSTGSNSTYSYSARLDNLLKYSVKQGPVELMAHYAVSGQATGSKPGSGYGAGARWRAANFSVETAYDQRYGLPNAQGLYSDTQAISLSGQYKAGSAALTLGGILYDMKPATGAERESDLYWASVEYQVNAPLSVLAAVYREDLANTKSDPTMLVLNATYALSKRTDVYVTTAYASAKRDGNVQTPVGVVRTSEQTPYYANQTGAIVGVRHRF